MKKLGFENQLIQLKHTKFHTHLKAILGDPHYSDYSKYSYTASEPATFSLGDINNSKPFSFKVRV